MVSEKISSFFVFMFLLPCLVLLHVFIEGNIVASDRFFLVLYSHMEDVIGSSSMCDTCIVEQPTI